MLCTHKTASSASLVLEICPQFNNSYLNQFSSISGGNYIKIVLPGSIASCAWSNTLCTLIPINHDDPDGIILSNFMLALVVLNNSIIRPPCFDLPIICHPFFMVFVKLNRSLFNSGTIFTSQVSLAMDPSLCLQMTSNFP